MKDLTIMLEDRPGKLATVGHATGAAEVNIEGLCATTREGKGEIHILVENAVAAREALGSAGIRVSEERDVLVLELEDRPGAMSEVASKLADRGVNIELAYTTFGGVKLVLGLDDLDKARAVL
jgi:hypothetical protein